MLCTVYIYIYIICNIAVVCSLQGKVSNKQDDVWIMTRLIKQLTDMGFPVC